MELQYTPRIIYKMERDANSKLINMIREFDMTTLKNLVKYGMNCSDDAAFNAIEEYLAESDTHDTITLFDKIIKVLQEGGFLPREATVKQKQAELDAQNKASMEAEMKNPDPSVNSGNEMNPKL